MAVKNPVANVANADIMNAVRMYASNDYQDRIPVVTQNNLAASATAILNYQPTYNEFAAALVDKFALQYVHSQIITNRLATFKRPPVRLGRNVEEIFVDAAKDQGFSPELAESRVFKRVIPDIGTIYHTINRQAQYKHTIERVVLERAFFEEYGLANVIGQIIQALYNGDNNDEYLIMKQGLAALYTAGLLYPVNTTAVTDEDTAKDFVQSVREYVEAFALPSRKYNSMGVLRQADTSDLVLFITPKIAATVDVRVLAAAFHMNEAEFMARRIVIDDFGTGNTAIQAILADPEIIMQWDTYYGADSIWNPEGLYTNVTLTHMGIYSTSRFANAVVFTSAASDVTTVTVAGSSTASVGTSQVYNATVASTASNYSPKAVAWSVSGQNSSGTYITNAGRLVISSEETASSLTVKATSIFDDTKSGTQAVTVS